MRSHRPFLLKSTFSIIDQVMLSGLNFLIGLALIRYASKDAYGLYSQLYATGLLSTVLLDALIGSALTTMAMRLEGSGRQRLIVHSQLLYWMASLMLAIVFGCGVWMLSGRLQSMESGPELGLAFAAYVFALGSREFCRTVLFIQTRPEVVAKLDFGFVVLTFASAAALAVFGTPSITQIIAVLAASNIIAVLPFLKRSLQVEGFRLELKSLRHDATSLWALSRWALIGSLIGWSVNNSYLFFAGAYVGVEAIADLNASRLLLVPIAVIGTAWARVARPRLGQHLANGDWQGLRRFSWLSVGAMETLTVVYLGVMLLAFPWLSAHLLSPKYSNVLGLLAVWGLYFIVNSARNVTSAILISHGAFRALFWQGAGLLVVMILASAASMWLLGVHGVVVGMIVTEALELAVNCYLLIPMARAQRLKVH